MATAAKKENGSKVATRGQVAEKLIEEYKRIEFEIKMKAITQVDRQLYRWDKA
ncbi:hypothetical protein COBT_003704, partial [Conglomerata obtusa]